MSRDDRRDPPPPSGEAEAPGGPPREASDSAAATLIDDELEDFDHDFADDTFMQRVARAPQPSWEAAPGAEGMAPFTGTARFVVEDLLGSGGFGDVYRVHDRERGVPLALKHLRKAHPQWLYRFKQEFRALARVVHPNLVTLYDLSLEAGQAFFTMELITGSELLDWVRPAGHLDEDRLRRSFQQLASGVAFLHRERKVHRDLKPSNVLVTDEGRVVILDFGLLFDLDMATTGGAVAGTPGYMSPEQAAGAPVTAATDWYAVGVMLFEALTGRLPFVGSTREVIEQKRRDDPPPPARLAPGIPGDLAELCLDLLRREPRDRPSGQQVLERLPQDVATGEPPAPDVGAEPFHGRRTELASLHEALAKARAGRPAWVTVHGGSGMGKSSLLDRFVAEARDRCPGLIVLQGACYERESVPYKALDGVVDALSGHLRRVGPDQAARFLGEEGDKLTRLFPVLGAAHPQRRETALPSALEARELFHEAAAALRAILRRLTTAAPVVVAIDDLQWGDLDSAELLAEVLDSAAAPTLCLVTCYRTEEAETSPVLRLLAERRDRLARHLETWEIALAGLDAEEARELALALLGDRASDPAGLAAAIAREAGGSPFFIDELSRHGLAELSSTATGGGPEVYRAITRRVASLPSPARGILEVVAVSGRPVATALACAAAQLDVVDPGALAVLRAQRLVRSRLEGAVESLECYHDRIRQSLLDQLTAADLRARNAALAAALEGSGQADPERLAAHFRDGGDATRAARYALEAADRAAEALAFDRAARLYGEALELRPDRPPTETQILRLKLATSLANAGRGALAARAYSEAAAQETGPARIALRIQAAEQLFRGGSPAAAIAAARVALAPLGLRLPRTRVGALLRLLVDRARLRLRGLNAAGGPAPALSDLDLLRIDAGWFFANAMLGLDPILGLTLHTAILLDALRCGRPERLARSLATEATVRSLRPGGQRRAQEIYAQAEAMIPESAREYRAYVLTGKTTIASAATRFAEGAAAAEEAEAIYLGSFVGTISEATMVRLFHLVCLFYLGRWNELNATYERFRHDCAQREDLFWYYLGETHFGWLGPVLEDDVPGARRAVDEVEGLQPSIGLEIPHASPLLARGWVERYAGDWASAWRNLDALWPRLRATGAAWIAILEVRLRMERATAALGALARGALEGREARRARRTLDRDVKRLERLGRQGIGGAAAVGRLCRAGLAGLARDRSASLALLEEAEEALGLHATEAHRAAARRQRGVLLGGEAGRALVAEADAYLSAQGARRPDRVAAMLVAGWNEPAG